MIFLEIFCFIPKRNISIPALPTASCVAAFFLPVVAPPAVVLLMAISATPPEELRAAGPRVLPPGSTPSSPQLSQPRARLHCEAQTQGWRLRRQPGCTPRWVRGEVVNLLPTRARELGHLVPPASAGVSSGLGRCVAPLPSAAAAPQFWGALGPREGEVQALHQDTVRLPRPARSQQRPMLLGSQHQRLPWLPTRGEQAGHCGLGRGRPYP